MLRLILVLIAKVLAVRMRRSIRAAAAQSAPGSFWFKLGRAIGS